MTPEERDRLMDLCEKITTENDRQKFSALVLELSYFLERIGDKLQASNSGFIVFHPVFFAGEKIVEFLHQFHKLLVALFRSDLVAQRHHAFSFIRGHLPPLGNVYRERFLYHKVK
jgi:hypothetical protein